MISKLREIMLSKALAENPKLIEINDWIVELISRLGIDPSISQEELDKKKSEYSIASYRAENELKKTINRLFNKKKYGLEIRLNNIALDNLTRYEKLLKRKNEITQLLQSEYLKKDTIKDLGLTLTDAISIAQKNNIPFVLEEEDKKIINNPERYDGMENFVLVHKTNYIPEGGRIRTAKESNVTNDGYFALDRVGSYKYAVERNTIHFSVNGEVSSHSYGNWDDTKYAIVIPLGDMPIKNLRSAAVMDTFFESGIQMPKKAIFLCPEEDLDKVKAQNPDLQIIAYKGKNVKGYADSIVGMLGKHVEEIGMWNWFSNNGNKYYEMLKNEVGDHISTAPHVATPEKEEEDYFSSINHFNALNDKIIDEKIPFTKEDYLKVNEDNNINFLFNNLFGNELSKQNTRIGLNRVREALSIKGINLSYELEEKVEDILNRIDLGSNPCLTEEEIHEYLSRYGKNYNSYSYVTSHDYIRYFVLKNVYQAIEKKLTMEEPEETVELSSSVSM